MTEQPVFDITEGVWRMTGSYADENNIIIYKDGKHYKTVTFPTYKIWNLVAHFDEVIEGLEEEASGESS